MAGTKDKKSAEKRNSERHAGHRQRMRDKFDTVGFDGWSKYEIVEYMLYYARPRVNMNNIAHDLLDFSCGNIVDMLDDACIKDKLKCISGVGDEVIRFLRGLKEFVNYYKREELKHKRVKLTRSNFNEVVNAIGMSKENENIFMICLDRRMQIKNVIDLTVGSDMYGATTEMDRIIRLAAGAKAENVVLLHNHPSGRAEVSRQDVMFTDRVDSMLKTLDIFLVDHYIIAGGKVVSIKMSG